MSDQPNDSWPAEGAAEGAGGGTRRTAHIDVSASAGEPTMDPANQSLIEAMRITYRLLMLGMGALAVVYLFSGIQPIDEGQRGVRTLFGKISGTSLKSGFNWAFPPPFGEIVRVPTGAQTISIDEAFFPLVADADRSKTIELLSTSSAAKTSLDPTRDGAMITADGNIAHARWEVTYVLEDPTAQLQTVDERALEPIIRAAVGRAVVRVVAGVTIDDLLKQSAGQEGSVVGRVRDEAQRHLDRIAFDGRSGIGVRIERIDLVDKVPPLTLYKDFAAVQSAESEANQRVETARTVAEATLNRVAGRASSPLVTLIDAYERAIEIGDAEAREDVFASIQSVLSGEPMTVPAEEGTLSLPEDYISGEVTRILAESESESDALVTTARSDDAVFRAKLVQLRQNSAVALQRSWADAFATLMADDTLQTLVLPPRASLVEVLLNQDPQLRRERERAAKLREVNQSYVDRIDLLNQPAGLRAEQAELEE
ncbi:MAG: SPFH domain-containing protein [Planctomycetota bacterium]